MFLDLSCWVSVQWIARDCSSWLVSFGWTVRAGTNATRAGGCRVARDSAAGFKQNLEG